MLEAMPKAGEWNAGGFSLQTGQSIDTHCPHFSACYFSRNYTLAVFASMGVEFCLEH